MKKEERIALEKKYKSIKKLKLSLDLTRGKPSSEQLDFSNLVMSNLKTKRDYRFDNTDIRNILNDLILDAGYKTRVAANYNQALSEIDKKIPDVAILDVKLDKGDNDGIELLSHIKSKN